MSLHVWGVDTGADACHVAAIPVTDLRVGIVAERVVMETWRAQGPPKSTVRLSALYGVVYTRARQLGRSAPPLIAWVEQPAGRARQPALMAAWGVIRCALYDAFADEGAAPVSVHGFTPTQWKKAMLGNGNTPPAAYQAHVAELLQRDVPVDHAAAFLIAKAGAALIAPESLAAAA